MFMTNVWWESICWERKIRELEKWISKTKLLSDQSRSKITSMIIIKHSADNMGNVISKKYGISPNDTETKSLFSE